MAFDWRTRCGSKLVALEAAVGHVKSGHSVTAAPYTCSPYTLCQGLIERGRKGHLADVRVDHLASLVCWTEPELSGAFRLRDNYATAANREACHAGLSDYLPIGLFREHEIPDGVSQTPDFFLVPVSPPDERGYCSFGPGVWMSPITARKADCVIAEVREDFIRTGGENFIHIDEIDLFVEGQAPKNVPAPPPSEEEVAQVEAICTHVAVDLIRDGDTLQIGVGTASASLGLFLDFRNDLGIQTELITGGIADLVANGNVTGQRKSIHRGKVVGSALAALGPEEFAKIHENPTFELYDFGYTDDLRRLIQLDNFVTVNNAMVVDLTGQVSAEAFDHRPYTGVGGQTVFMIAGAYSPNGKSVSVVPSSSVPSTGNGQRVTRIVPTLAAGTPVTVPRTYVDFVVTEFGIAELRGKTVQERARALCEIAHPDFRDSLRDEARQLYHA